MRIDSSGFVGIGTTSPTTPLQVNGTITAPLLADTLGGSVAPSSSVMRNRIINGAMVIDQRNAGASVTPTSTGFSLDRWAVVLSVASKYSVQQNAGSVTPPVGFTNYLGATSLSAYTVGAAENFAIVQRVEGYNIADLGWGTANAKTVTLSFWVRSSLTGTFGGAIRNGVPDRSYPFSYTINAANTWEYKTITIAGETTGTWLTTNGIGLSLVFSLGAGSSVSGTAGAWSSSSLFSATGATSVVGTDGATFYITGVQLEVGTQATSFEYRQYGTELALCQRYYQIIGDSSSNSVGYATDTSAAAQSMYITISYPVAMRTAASATVATFQVANTGQPTVLSGASSLTFAVVSIASGRVAARSDTVAKPIELSAEL
jgi:hypothetical protein